MNSAAQILDIAERRMRNNGYNAVSYREIAAEMGIKSASVHYHFPRKEDLGRSLVQRYTANFAASLKDATDGLTEPLAMLKEFVGLYRRALTEQRLSCLCAVLGAEAPSLPEPIVEDIKEFFSANVDWLTEQYTKAGAEHPQQRAKTALSTLSGAMIISSVMNDVDVFEAAAKAVTAMPASTS